MDGLLRPDTPPTWNEKTVSLGGGEHGMMGWVGGGDKQTTMAKASMQGILYNLRFKSHDNVI
jgi:hypothetical protein